MDADFKLASSIIKKHIKVDGKIYIRRQRLSRKIDGYCFKKGNDFVIQINKNLPLYVAVDVVLHEAAHILAHGKDKDDHGLNWGKSYSKIYRIFLQEYYD